MSLLLKQYLEETWALRQLKCVLFFFSWFEHNAWHQYHKLFQCYLGIRGNEGRRLLKSHFWFCSFKSYVFQKKWGPNFQVPIVPCWIQIFRKIPFSFTLLNRAFFHKRSAASNSFWPGSHWESWPFFFFFYPSVPERERGALLWVRFFRQVMPDEPGSEGRSEVQLSSLKPPEVVGARETQTTAGQR